MKLRDYIEKASPAGEPMGLNNRVMKRLAARAKISIHTLHSIALGRRHASAKTAAKIEQATEFFVEAKEMMNHDRKKPGPKRRQP